MVREGFLLGFASRVCNHEPCLVDLHDLSQEFVGIRVSGSLILDLAGQQIRCYLTEFIQIPATPTGVYRPPLGGFFSTTPQCFAKETYMKLDDSVVGFMKTTLEAVGYDIYKDETGWRWAHLEDEESQQSFSKPEDAISESWDTASEFVRDVLGGSDSPELWAARWRTMSVAQQAKLILMCFEDGEDDRDVVASGLFKMIRENEALRQTIGILGSAIESGDKAMASTIWAQAQQSHGIAMYPQ